MTDIRQPSLSSVVQDRLGAMNVLVAGRCLTVVAGLLCIWVTLAPFPYLGNLDARDAVTGQLAATYITFGLLALAAIALSVHGNVPALKTLWTPVHLCFLAWMAVNIVMSETPGVSLQRFVLTASIMTLAVLTPLLPPTQDDFNKCFASAALVLLALCYLGLIVVPDLAIHNIHDIVEPQLAGDWRGTFSHKNVAAPTMVILAYIGLYLTFAGRILTGSVILIFAGIFVVFAGGKSAGALSLAMLALAHIINATKGLWLKRIVCFAPLIVMNCLTVGTVMNDTLKSITERLPIDATFTGRTEVWEFALAAFWEKPVFGHGFAAFWDNSSDRIGAQGSEWAVEASHSHNSYLELALNIGLPGLVLGLLIFVLAPLNNFHAIQERGQNGPLAKMFLVIWLFGIYLATTETFILERQNPTWFIFMIAVAGLHYLARFRAR
jgi:O-antigen ligase